METIHTRQTFVFPSGHQKAPQTQPTHVCKSISCDLHAGIVSQTTKPIQVFLYSAFQSPGSRVFWLQTQKSNGGHRLKSHFGVPFYSHLILHFPHGRKENERRKWFALNQPSCSRERNDPARIFLISTLDPGWLRHLRVLPHHLSTMPASHSGLDLPLFPRMSSSWNAFPCCETLHMVWRCIAVTGVIKSWVAKS